MALTLPHHVSQHSSEAFNHNFKAVSLSLRFLLESFQVALLSCSRFSPSFHLQVPLFFSSIHNFIPILMPQQPFIRFPSYFFPFHTSQEHDEMAHGLHSTIHYWYMRIGIAIVGEPSLTWTTHLALLTRTREPRHLRTPTTGLAMGQGLRNQEGDPPPHPTEELTSRESNCPPARNRSSDSR